MPKVISHFAPSSRCTTFIRNHPFSLGCSFPPLRGTRLSGLAVHCCTLSTLAAAYPAMCGQRHCLAKPGRASWLAGGYQSNRASNAACLSGAEKDAPRPTTTPLRFSPSEGQRQTDSSYCFNEQFPRLGCRPPVTRIWR